MACFCVQPLVIDQSFFRGCGVLFCFTRTQRIIGFLFVSFEVWSIIFVVVFGIVFVLLDRSPGFTTNTEALYSFLLSSDGLDALRYPAVVVVCEKTRSSTSCVIVVLLLLISCRTQATAR